MQFIHSDNYKPTVNKKHKQFVTFTKNTSEIEVLLLITIQIFIFYCYIVDYILNDLHRLNYLLWL